MRVANSSKDGLDGWEQSCSYFIGSNDLLLLWIPGPGALFVLYRLWFCSTITGNGWRATGFLTFGGLTIQNPIWVYLSILLCLTPADFTSQMEIFQGLRSKKKISHNPFHPEGDFIDTTHQRETPHGLNG